MMFPQATALPEELDRLMRRMRLPYMRKAAPDVLATARAQRIPSAGEKVTLRHLTRNFPQIRACFWCGGRDSNPRPTNYESWWGCGGGSGRCFLGAAGPNRSSSSTTIV